MDYMKDIKEISAEEAVILWQASRLSLSKIYEKAPEILKVQGSVIGTLGNFSASIGKAKSKKTFNVSAIVAAALKNGTVLRYVAELPEEKRKILYVDTEQSPYHCLKVMKRILRMAGLPDDRRRVHHVKQARIRSAGSAAAARNGHRQEVCVRNTRHSQAVRVQPAHCQPHKEKR